MTSPGKIAANRRNAQKSTGPRTSAGKARVARNPLVHGLRARTILLPGEKRRHFQQLLQAFCDDHKPVGRLQRMLVEQMAVAYWKLGRITAVESFVYAEKSKDDTFIRDLRSAFSDVAEPAAASDRSRPTLSAQDRIGRAFLRDTTGYNTFSRLSYYEMRLERSFFRALHELQRLQALPSAACSRPVDPRSPPGIG